jgi:hypothetical protein
MLFSSDLVTFFLFYVLQITSLLQRSLTSKEPLTGLHFNNPVDYDNVALSALSDELCADEESDAVLSNVKIRVVHTKNSSLLYAEVSDGLVDLLFGLLSIPIGSVIKTYGQCSGCLYNLYRSIDADAKECVKSECLSMLVNPKSPPFSGCRSTNVFQVEDSAPKKLSINACFKCFKAYEFTYLGRCWEEDYRNRRWLYKYCQATVKSAKLSELNPKSPNKGNENGEAYMNTVPMKFMLTSDLHIRPHSISSTMGVLSEAKIRAGELLEKEIPVTKRLVCLRPAVDETPHFFSDTTCIDSSVFFSMYFYR